MKVTEITLTDRRALEFRDTYFATVERRDCGDRCDCLYLQFQKGVDLQLPGAVDVSERLDHSRIFSIQSLKADSLLLFGGEKAYWLAETGKVTNVLELYREYSTAEYWTTKIIERGEVTIIIYESGVLSISELLEVNWHKRKMINDEFVSIERDTLRFARDHDLAWTMRLKDGTSTDPEPEAFH